jgi:dihydroorotase
MLELAAKGYFAVEQVVTKMCHAPADLFRVQKRGYIQPGYFADLVLVNPAKSMPVTADLVLSKCGWSPFEGTTLHHTVEKTWVNGQLAYSDGKVNTAIRGKRLMFNKY